MHTVDWSLVGGRSVNYSLGEEKQKMRLLVSGEWTAQVLGSMERQPVGRGSIFGED